MLFGNHSLRTSSVLLLTGALVLTGGLLGCSRGGGGGGTGGSLQALSLDVQGQTDVKLNQPIRVTFNSGIDPTSVSVSGFQVQGAGRVFSGRIEISGNVISFFPTFFGGVDGRGVDQSVNMYNPSNNPPDNARGFDPATQYTVRVLGNSSLSPKGLNGRPLVREFSGFFRTGGDFLPEEPSVPPMVAEEIKFSQRAINEACNPDALNGNPDDDCAGMPVPEFDPANLEVSVKFSEPMNPGTFNPFTTFSLTNTFVDPPRAILGEVIPSGDLRTFSFRPLNTLGDDPNTDQPYRFEFVLSGAVEDLAGNSLVGNPLVDGREGQILAPIKFSFKTADKPGEPNFGGITEDFETRVNRKGQAGLDLGTTDNVWNGDGILEGAPATFRDVEVPVNPSQFLLPQPLTTAGNRIHHLIEKDVFNSGGAGNLESVISISWGPQSNFVFAAMYPTVAVSVGHTRQSSTASGLATTFSANFSGFPDNPTKVYEGVYDVPNALNEAFFPYPTFSTDFEYDGRSNVVLELDVAPGGTSFQLFKNESSACLPRFRVFGGYQRAQAGGAPGSQCGAGENTRYQHRLKLVLKKSYGVSLDLDTNDSNPDYQSSLVISDSARIGSSFDLTFTGKPPNNNIPPQGDDALAVGPVQDIDLIDGLRFVSFTFELNADPFTGIVPLIDSLSFTFRLD